VLKPVREKTAVPRYDRLCSHSSLRESVQMQPETRNDAKARATSTYNAAADYFDAPALSFWDRIGQRTVERMSLKVGACVLDACCGSGASAIPAAKAIGPSGRLLAVDLAENLLRLARGKASQLGLTHAEFHRTRVRYASNVSAIGPLGRLRLRPNISIYSKHWEIPFSLFSESYSHRVYKRSTA
jgi:SAM-dependent methyltransferase